MPELYNLSKYKCASCGAEFVARRAHWGYWYDCQICCSYKCMRAMEREENDRKDGRKVRRMTAEEIDRAVELRQAGKSFAAIGKIIGRTPQCVANTLNGLGKAIDIPQTTSRSQIGPKRAQPEPEAAPALPEGTEFVAVEVEMIMGLTREQFRNLTRSARAKGFKRSGGGVNNVSRYTLDDIRWLIDFKKRREECHINQPRMELVEMAKRLLEVG